MEHDALDANASMPRQVKGLSSDVQTLPEHTVETLNFLCERLLHLDSLVLDAPNSLKAKEEFQSSHGFEALLDTVSSIPFKSCLEDENGQYNAACLRVLEQSLLLFQDSLSDNGGGQQHFSKNMPDGGWTALEEALAAMRLEETISSACRVEPGFDLERLFGVFLGFCFSNRDLPEMLTDIDFRLAQHRNESRSSNSVSGVSSESDSASTINERDLVKIARTVSDRITDGEMHNPQNVQILPTVFTLWRHIPRSVSAQHQNYQILSLVIILALLRVAQCNAYVSIIIGKTKLSSMVLNTLIEQYTAKTLCDSELAALRQLYLELVKLGHLHSQDAIELSRNAMKSDVASDLLLRTIQVSRLPRQFIFDLSLQGYASLELAQIKEPFPPDPSKGYTFMCWFYVDKFDEQCHTTLFGAFDSTQTCFMLVYLDNRRHQLVLQTSISQKDPSIRFTSFIFQQGVWYHIAIVHKRSNNDSVSRAGLFVNGKFCEQVKCHYPAYARGPVSSNETSRLKQERTPIRQAPVQAFIGTPEALSPRSGETRLGLKWFLASAHFIAGVLQEDLITVCEKLGPGYYGNFQDCLGSFQTYSASAALNLRNELLNQGTDNNSIMAIALRSKASKLNPERNILLSITPLAVLNDKSAHSGLVQNYLSSEQRMGLLSNEKVLNAATPNIRQAVSKEYGTALMMGGCIASASISLEDIYWRLSGCVGLALKLVESSSSLLSLIRNAQIFFELVQNSWRNSEAMERSSGFSVLAWILRMKSHSTWFQEAKDDGKSEHWSQLLELTLAFVGMKRKNVNESIIINPLAYRALLVDCDIWRRSDLVTQRAYYDQFFVFGTQSLHRDFNAERLGRMRVVRRILEALKGETIQTEVLPSALKALETLLKCTMSADVLRSLSLFITYSLHIDEEPGDRKPMSEEQSRSGTPRPVSGLQNNGDMSMGSEPGCSTYIGTLSRKEIGSEVLKMLAGILCNDGTGKYAKRFARTVTSKWVLFLFAVQDESVVSSAARILARLLLISGPSYVLKFHETTKGFTILSRRLRKWWGLGQVWTVLFALFLGIDLSKLDVEIPFDDQYLLHKILSESDLRIFCPQIFPVMMSLLEQAVIHSNTFTSENPTKSGADQSESHEPEKTKVIMSVVNLLYSLHAEAAVFHDFTISSDVLKEFLNIIYFACYHDSQATGGKLKESSHTIEQPASAVAASTHSQENLILHRSSSFVVVKVAEQDMLSPVPFERPLAPKPNGYDMVALKGHLSRVILDLVTSMCTDRIMSQKDFPGLGLYLKVPPASDEERAFVNSRVIVNVLVQLEQEADSSLDIYLNTVSLTNVARFTLQTYEAILEGWFTGVSYSLLRYLATLLLKLQRPEVCRNKVVRLCSPSLSLMQQTFRRTVIFHLSTVHEQKDLHDTEQFLLDLVNWQELLFVQAEEDQSYMLSFCYLLYLKLINSQETIKLAALNLWRSLSIEHPQAMYLTLADYAHDQSLHATTGRTLAVFFKDKIEEVLDYVNKNRREIDSLFLGRPRTTLERRVKQENLDTYKAAQKRVSKRKYRLEERHLEDMAEEHTWTEHEVATGSWIANICASETYKQRRIRQDQSDNDLYIRSQFFKEETRLVKIKVTEDESVAIRWSLDEAEGYERKRLRLVPSKVGQVLDYKPKRTSVQDTANVKSLPPTAFEKTGSRGRSISGIFEAGRTRSSSLQTTGPQGESGNSKPQIEEDFEVVSEAQNGDVEGEDKNRKVMRSLQRGEKVLNVYNISRITGLEACESLLIIGKLSMYLISHYFQRSDGEVVSTWQAPIEERDPYTRIIAGKESGSVPSELPSDEEDVRHWPWESIISVSKRQFLLRSVALEIFFHDGRSYLLTAHSVAKRDELHESLINKVHGSKLLGSPEDVWRAEMLPNSQDTLATFGAKLTNVFQSSSTHPATKQWMKGELSNFQYLMLINTMAGRTFNDLTQYPIFPWIIADYTSDELDLSNPRVYRDLTKPMGCQTIEREQSFRERYNTLTEMVEDQAPFHYGTHYSSAMIVTSYLIRLQPFVRAYLLLQGGTFDHAERLFYSIEKAWLSASKESMTDVRELTPEFFYLPDFLINVNHYNFGKREGTGEVINDVKLPPWAKGDPNIFIQKQREALESSYVRQNLHHWIDLVFGFKQRGEAAREATNVFHYLSYQGAIDLDKISDQLERRATIGIIHNFGQTPRQVFNRPHDRCGQTPKNRRLDRSVEFLTRLPAAVLKVEEPITALCYSEKHQRILHGCLHEAIMPGDSLITVSWAYADGSLRFHSSQNKMLLGLFEQPSQDLLSVAAFADSRTLITASVDTTVCVWTVEVQNGKIDLQSQGHLFGHRHPVCVLNVSRALSTVLSADESGRVLWWDLNRLDLVREISVGAKIDCAQINNVNGHVVLCSEQKIFLYTFNGHKLLEQTISSSLDDRIFSCAVYEGNGREWVENEIIFTGHKNGVVSIWRLTNDRHGNWLLELVRRLEHIDRAMGAGNYLAPITCILPRDQQLYTADADGRAFEWTCVR